MQSKKIKWHASQVAYYVPAYNVCSYASIMQIKTLIKNV